MGFIRSGQARCSGDSLGWIFCSPSGSTDLALHFFPESHEIGVSTAIVIRINFAAEAVALIEDGDEVRAEGIGVI